MKNERGFTLLEVMLAVAIFGFLMLMVAQIMNGEIRMLNAASRQNDIEQKARTAMVHILDEIKLNRFTHYSIENENIEVYIQEPESERSCLIFIPKEDIDINSLPNGTKIYYQPNEGKLWYRSGSSRHLIADNISTIDVSQVGGRQLLEIHIKAKDSSSSAEYELLTWTRMY